MLFAFHALAEPAYEQRYCAFVDILGFGELIDRLNQGQTSFRSLQELLTKVHNPPPTTASAHEESDFRAQSISDAVALSAAINTAGIGNVSNVSILSKHKSYQSKVERMAGNFPEMEYKAEAEPIPDNIPLPELAEQVVRGKVKLTPMQQRMLIELLPFYMPKLSAVGVGYLTNDTFAERLDRAIARSDRAKLIEGHAIRDEGC